MRKLILTDVDGTVLRMDHMFEAWMIERGYPVRSAMRDHYSIAHAFGVTEREAVQSVVDFFDDECSARLPAETCAAQVLPDLYRDGWRFVAVTAAPHAAHVIAARRRNLEDVFGFPWDAVHCTGIHGEKRPILAAYEPAIWVEDHFYNGVSGAECGHRVFLMDRGYNRERFHPEISRVRDWHEIANSI